ncbi:hypothetical protein HDU93_010009 [Gonapodya sp. JEL0774]|nr:hypothetical protein HDU93_010009 [Gonapodya sp. JEL0774]
MLVKMLLAVFMALIAASSTSAHVEFAVESAPNGTTFDATMRIGHGCAALYDTQSLNITIPAQFTSLRPRFSLNQNATVTKGVNGTFLFVSFTKPVPNADYDYVQFAVKTPASGGKFYFPTYQACGANFTNWAQISMDDDDSGAETDPTMGPAPVLTIGSS